MLTIAKVRKAARLLQAEDTDVSYKGLASLLNSTQTDVYVFVKKYRLRKGLGITTDHFFPGLTYMHAADRIRQRGECVTIVTLARELKKNKRTVTERLRYHPEWKKHLGIVTRGESGRDRRERLYADAVHKLFTSGTKITRYSVARLVGRHKSSVCKDIATMPDLLNFLR